jgi:hypothetical protein
MMRSRIHSTRQIKTGERSIANNLSKGGLSMPSTPFQFVQNDVLNYLTNNPVQLMSYNKKKLTSKVLNSTVKKHVAASKEEAFTKFMNRKEQKRQSFVDSEQTLTSLVDGDNRDAMETRIINRQMDVRYLETNSDNPTKEDISHYEPTKWMCELGVDKVTDGDQEHLSIFHFKSL